ncbi:hypothetical protein ACIBI9_48920 [Nonomuraea sp. NPDC050451]|uniref:hypothetical protein n=1 Tax=Nonomuraea sp. NPDC050451 TaxID=3364364 RepID=UPI00378E1426
MAEAAGSASAGRVYGSVAEALAAVPVDVLVDYTSAAAVKDNVSPGAASTRYGCPASW